MTNNDYLLTCTKSSRFHGMGQVDMLDEFNLSAFAQINVYFKQIGKICVETNYFDSSLF